MFFLMKKKGAFRLRAVRNFTLIEFYDLSGYLAFGGPKRIALAISIADGL